MKRTGRSSTRCTCSPVPCSRFSSAAQKSVTVAQCLVNMEAAPGRSQPQRSRQWLLCRNLLANYIHVINSANYCLPFRISGTAWKAQGMGFRQPFCRCPSMKTLGILGIHGTLRRDNQGRHSAAITCCDSLRSNDTGMCSQSSQSQVLV